MKEEISKLLDEIRPNSEEQIKKRIKMGSFAKVVIWACASSQDCDYIGVKDLSRFMRISLQRARYILEDMVKFGLLKRNKISGCMVDYYFTLDSLDKPKVFKYFELSKEALGIRLKVDNIKVEPKGL